MSRVDTQSGAFNDHPFDGDGVSLYARAGSEVQYRNVRVLPVSRGRRRNGAIKGTGGNHSLGAASVLKTARVASAAAPAVTLDFTLPAAMLGQTVTFDVRRYKDDVENESTAYRTVTAAVDGSGEDATGILGTASLVSVEKRAGGVCRIRFTWTASRVGVQPVRFRAARTAGPTSPSSTTVGVVDRQRLYEIDTAALSDASAYTFKITAENAAGTITADVLTGITVTADATGPTAPGSITAEAV